MVGALVEGLPISDGQYAGGEFGWVSYSVFRGKVRPPSMNY